jgi:hypothetical protein
MKQEVKPTVFMAAAAAIVVVVALLFWRFLSPPLDAALLESRVGPKGNVAAPPPGAMPGKGAPVGAGPMPPPGAAMPGPGAPVGAGPMPPPGAR